jgi:tryptophanyl-tRNA synthetase
MTLVSGARLSPGGLHLGHFLGCLSPLEQIPPGAHYFFVITDKVTPEQLVCEDDPDFRDIVLDLLSSPFSERITICRQSEILATAPVLHAVLGHFISLNQLIRVHPKRQEIRAGVKTPSLAEMFFVLDVTCYILALNGTIVLMNDDNSRFVDFARSVARKLNASYGMLFNLPVLQHGCQPRLLGFNYRKMAKANGNAIFVSDDPGVLRAKVRRLFLRRYYLKFRKDHAGVGNHFFTSDFLPFQYLRTLRPGDASEQVIASFTAGKMSLEELQNEVFIVLNSILEPMRVARAKISQNAPEITERLEKDRRLTLTVVEGIEQRIVMMLREVASRRPPSKDLPIRGIED